MPTVLSALEIETPLTDGLDLLPVMNGERRETVGLVQSSENTYQCRRCVRTDRWKLILTVDDNYFSLPPKELCDLETDPGELVSRVDELPKVTAELERRMERWVEETLEHAGCLSEGDPLKQWPLTHSLGQEHVKVVDGRRLDHYDFANREAAEHGRLFLRGRLVALVRPDSRAPGSAQIHERMGARRQQICELKRSGLVCEAPDGTLAIAQDAAIPDGQRPTLEYLVEAENGDRRDLFRCAATASRIHCGIFGGHDGLTRAIGELYSELVSK